MAKKRSIDLWIWKEASLAKKRSIDLWILVEGKKRLLVIDKTDNGYYAHLPGCSLVINLETGKTIYNHQKYPSIIIDELKKIIYDNIANRI